MYARRVSARIGQYSSGRCVKVFRPAKVIVNDLGHAQGEAGFVEFWNHQDGNPHHQIRES